MTDPGMRQSLTPQLLQQQLQLTQKIAFANLMEIPDEILSAVAEKVIYNPEGIESILLSKKDKKIQENNIAGKTQTIYSSFSDCSINRNNKNNGMIISPDVKPLENHLNICQVEVTPDATYIGRHNYKPEIVFSDHLKGARNLLRMELDSSKFPETSKLMHQLKRFDEWKRGKLRDAYFVFGDTQREFFEDLNYKRCHAFIGKNMAEKLDLSQGTVSRLLSNRWVEARSIKGDTKFFYIKDLFFSRDDLAKAQVTPYLNKIFEEEFKSKNAYSDFEISKKVKDIARRTVAKYRTESGIPNFLERREIYRIGILDKPYQFSER